MYGGCLLCPLYPLLTQNWFVSLYATASGFSIEITIKIRFYYQLVISIISFISFQKGKLMSLYLGRLLLLGIANYHIIYCFIGDLLPFHGSGLRSMLLNSWITPNAHQNWDVTIILPFYGKGKGNSFWVLTSVARNPGLEIVIIWKKSWGQRSYPLSPSVLRLVVRVFKATYKAMQVSPCTLRPI